MTDLYLIAHKVRGEATFDIATRLSCSICQVEYDPIYENMLRPPGPHNIGKCDRCNNLGYTWIVPTSGHEAHPWWSANLLDIDDQYQLDFEPTQLNGPGPMPPNLRDHYTVTKPPKFDLAAALGIVAKINAPLSPPAKLPPLKRRF